MNPNECSPDSNAGVRVNSKPHDFGATYEPALKVEGRVHITIPESTAQYLRALLGNMEANNPVFTKLFDVLEDALPEEGRLNLRDSRALRVFDMGNPDSYRPY